MFSLLLQVQLLLVLVAARHPKLLLPGLLAVALWGRGKTWPIQNVIENMLPIHWTSSRLVTSWPTSSVDINTLFPMTGKRLLQLLQEVVLQAPAVVVCGGSTLMIPLALKCKFLTPVPQRFWNFHVAYWKVLKVWWLMSFFFLSLFSVALCQCWWCLFCSSRLSSCFTSGANTPALKKSFIPSYFEFFVYFLIIPWMNGRPSGCFYPYPDQPSI